MQRRSAIAILAAATLLGADPVVAQNLIAQDGWEGFVTRSPDGRFDRCVLYNRTVRAIEASPYKMLGISRDAKSSVGLMVFYEPRALTRSPRAAVQLRIDGRAPVSLSGDVVSDFHVVVRGPLDAATLAALHGARELEIATDFKPIRFTLTGVAAVLERLQACVDGNARASAAQ